MNKLKLYKLTLIYYGTHYEQSNKFLNDLLGTNVLWNFYKHGTIQKYQI